MQSVTTMTAPGVCTCRPPHGRAQHRNGRGRCTVPGCACLFAPPAPVKNLAPDPAPAGVATVDGDGLVLAFQPPARAPRRPSKLEAKLWNRLDRAGLPLPTLEYRFALSEGRQYRADGAYVDAKLLIEVEGGIWVGGRHNRGGGFDDDAEKYNLAALLGWRVLRFTNRMIADGTAIQTITRALERDDPAQLLLIGGES
jgi:very-short-patch-repair endonuclease